MSACLETNRGDILSGFSESVRDFAKEARLVFMQDGVHLLGKDSAGIAMVRYFLPAEKINGNGHGRYSCSCPMVDVGIDTRMVANCLNNISCGDLVGFSVDTENDPDILMIRCQNAVTGKWGTMRVITPETVDDPITHNSIESCGYNSEIIMSSTLFHEIMRDLKKSDSLSIRVFCDGNRLVFAANGRHIKASFEVMHGKDQSQFSYVSKPGDRWPVCECYSMTYLQKVAKAKGVSSYISMHLLPNFTIGFTYKTCVGALSYMISSRDDEEWVENPATRVMPAVSKEIVGILPRTRMSSGKKRMMDDITHATKARMGVRKEEVKVAVDRESESESEEEDEEEVVDDDDANQDQEDEEEEVEEPAPKKRKGIIVARETS